MKVVCWGMSAAAACSLCFFWLGGVLWGPFGGSYAHTGHPLLYFHHHAIISVMTDKKMWKELRKKLAKQGCEFVDTSGAHFKVYRDGTLITVMQRSAANPRAYLNKITELRRKGITI